MTTYSAEVTVPLGPLGAIHKKRASIYRAEPNEVPQVVATVGVTVASGEVWPDTDRPVGPDGTVYEVSHHWDPVGADGPNCQWIADVRVAEVGE